ncbi:3-isopropylmalate dehydratase large subunit [Paraburkholderia aspalathi]|uniref:3-isopropylmalate dehydratase large subunit n=1 Tax=Paraburkholderia aspalathi TaxID=1324617 RepID=A0A1I7B4Z8_9BURK|nr:3-isopropylmalate dehydratase large subunit [Paraburkholderia aspalathi]SFT82259.1 3-isopropylmalate dehydratase, large subunit [Paraburkholderia aspalathi]
MPTSTTFYRKLVDTHTVSRIDDQNVLLYVDLHLMNEYTSPQAFSGVRAKNRHVRRPHQQLAVVSHIIPTHAESPRVIRDSASLLLADNLARNCDEAGIRLFAANNLLQGIEHIIAPELGLIRPGMVVLCGDSHTTTYGALGALGFGIGTSEVEHVLATQTLVYRVAQTMRITIDGALPYGTSSKDLIIWIISQIGAQGARGYAVEFAGSTVAALSAEARMTLCNMTVEAGARAALIAPDQVTFDYVRAHATSLDDAAWQTALTDWAQLRSDEGATFDAEHHFDASEIAPYVTWGTSPDQAMRVDELVPDAASQVTPEAAAALQRALKYIDLESHRPIAGTPIDRVFIGSCTNGRIEDLRIVAEIVRGRKVAQGVRAMIVPGSGSVRRQAEAEGIAHILKSAGFEWREPGCSMCLAMNDDFLQAGERCASTTNRNFEGRQGRGGRTHLMSPAMAAAAALTGKITDVRTLESFHV